MRSQLKRAKDLSQQHSSKLAELYKALLCMFKHHSKRELLWQAICTPCTMDYLEAQLGCHLPTHCCTTAGCRCFASATRTFTSIALQGTQDLLRTRYYVGQQINSRLAKEQSSDTQHIPLIPHANSTQAPRETPLPSNELEVHVHKLLNRKRNGPDIRECTESFNARRAKQSYKL
jgi:hypothetical protein